MAPGGRVAPPQPSLGGAAASQECLRGLKYLRLADSEEVHNRRKLIAPIPRAERRASTLLERPSEASVAQLISRPANLSPQIREVGFRRVRKEGREGNPRGR